MGFSAKPKGTVKQGKEEDTRALVKYITFVDTRGVKCHVAVFEGETDADALQRARAIDARLGTKRTF
jgi:hypothetical protein